jgi:hypothetical protein
MAQAGTVLGGRYVLGDQIGYGGYGEMWRATDTVLTRPVAVKLLHPRYAQRSEALARFRAEARHAGGLSHENIAQVFDYGEPADGQPPYLVMELVDGPSLETVLTGGPLDDSRTMDIVAQAAAGLQAGTPLEVALAHRDRPLPPLPPSVAVGVAALVLWMAAKDPARRLSDAAEVAVWAGLLRDGVGVARRGHGRHRTGPSGRRIGPGPRGPCRPPRFGGRRCTGPRRATEYHGHARHPGPDLQGLRRLDRREGRAGGARRTFWKSSVSGPPIRSSVWNRLPELPGTVTRWRAGSANW